MNRRPFTYQEYEQIRLLLLDQDNTNVEIAKILNRNKASLSVFINKHFGGNPAYLKRITKHKHLHEAVLIYFKNHTFEETAEEFELTSSELKSCMTYAYKDPQLFNLRKDTRQNHRNLWTAEQLTTMLRMCGIFSRDSIAKKINRGNARVVKEKLIDLKVSSRNINGINLSQFEKGFGFKTDKVVSKNAGSPSKNGTSYFKIVLWDDLEKMIATKEIETFPVYEKLIYTMANFQRWLWNTNNVRPKVLKMISEET